VLYLSCGCTIVVCRDHLAETVLADANRHGATFLYAAPMHYQMLAADTSGLGFPELKRAISTSFGLPEEAADAFRVRFGLPVRQAYGIIEVGLPLIDLDGAAGDAETIGRPLADYDVALLDEERHPVDEGEVGELAVRGPGMFAAYLSPPQPRGDVLHDGWFLTGDLARPRDDGRILIVGRCKSMINVGGQKVFPEAIEAVINAHPSVAQSRVSARPHARLGEVVHADVVASGVTAEDVMAHCRARLAALEVPQSVRFVPRIEETSSGKVRRR